ncbi:hypothetical protein, partial [Ochrobactrum sp. SFR4]|uniref:hypothetical protein n=1 Tax=Ochrobactrum sp. SFR4 TaxID=2717368 RepID=UPI001C8CF08A
MNQDTFEPKEYQSSLSYLRTRYIVAPMQQPLASALIVALSNFVDKRSKNDHPRVIVVKNLTDFATYSI